MLLAPEGLQQAGFTGSAITDRQEVIIKHFVDSLLNVDKLSGQKFIDVGSGGGFPAIPIRIYKEDIMLTMVEATGKKCEFLKEVVHKLNLTNVNILCARAEELAKDKAYREQFDVCSARAVARLNTLCEYCMPFVKIGGKFVAYKGDALEELNEAQSAIIQLGGQVDRIDKFDLLGAKREIISIKKIQNTKEKYPRANGQIRKKPL